MIDNIDFDIIMKHASKACIDEDVLEYNQLDTQNIEINQKTTRKVKRTLFFKTFQELKGVIVLKKITAACLLICTVVLGIAMSIQPVRAAFWDAIITWYDKYIGILFVSDNEVEPPTIIEKVIIPPLDDGWNIEIISETQSLVVYIITGPQGEEIIYDQQVYAPNEIKVDNTGCVIEEIFLDPDVEAYLCNYDDGRVNIVWKDKYLFSITSDQVPVDYLIEIARNIQD